MEMNKRQTQDGGKLKRNALGALYDVLSLTHILTLQLAIHSVS